MDDEGLDHLMSVAAGPTRPPAEFEEDLLLRLEIRAAAKDADPAVLSAIDEVIDVDFGQQPAPGRSTGRAWVLVAAAAAAVIGLFVVTDHNADSTSMTDSPEAPASTSTTAPDVGPAELSTVIAAVDEACAAHLAGLNASVPPGTLTLDTSDGVRPLAVVRVFVDDLVLALSAGRGLSEVDPLLEELADSENRVANEQARVDVGADDGLRYSVPSVANSLRATAQAAFELGATSCETDNQ